MASLQHPTASLQSKHVLIPRNTLAQKPILNLSLRSTTFTPLKLKFVVTRRSNGATGARMSATAASSYATALADVANANNTLDATTADIEKIEEIFSDPQVSDFFADPTLAVEKKRKLVDDIAESSGFQGHTRNFLYILVEAQRIDLINDIAKEFELVYNTLTETELAVVTSVVKLESQHLAQIAKQVQKLTGAKNVRIKTLLDPTLVAGFTVRYGNSGSKLIDMSVKKQLEDIAAQLELGDITLTITFIPFNKANPFLQSILGSTETRICGGASIRTSYILGDPTLVTVRETFRECPGSIFGMVIAG
ncbi:ATP synthase delta chain, chloroplastic, partial [Mucuna pruriens]